MYDNTLTCLVDKHAPVNERSVRLRQDTAWYNEDLRNEKRVKRQKERAWRKSKLEVHRQIYVDQCKRVNNLLTKTKAAYYSHMVSDAGNNQQRLFRIVNRLLHRKGQSVLPVHTSSAETAKVISEYFSGKIDICRELSVCRDADECVDNNTSRGFTSELSSFVAPRMEVIKHIITDASPKSCDLDPTPTWLIAESVDELLPMLSRIITTSLHSSTVPDKFKIGYISPLINKPGLSSDSLQKKTYRPVQNLSFISKVVERVVAQQLTSHMGENNLHEQMQSAYRQNHSTETALLKVHSDILSAVDNGCVVVLVLLDLTAAFDTIYHGILLS